MIPAEELIIIAHDRLTDAEALLAARQYDGAVYLVGYAVEIALKYRICKTLDWAAFPATNREFDNYKSFKIHDLNVLLSFTGIGATVKLNYLTEWSDLETWNPEDRYKLSGEVSADKAILMINSAKKIMQIL